MTGGGETRGGGTARRIGLAALSGLLLAAAHPPLDLSSIAFVALVPLLVVLEEIAEAGRGRPLRAWAGSAFGAGFVTGVGYFLALLWWIALLDAPALTIPWVRYPGTLAIAAYLALFPGLVALGVAWIRARTDLPPVVVVPALWVTSEWLRGVGELGFPWGEIGATQVPNLAALQLAAIFGLRGIGAWIVVANALALRVVRPTGRRAPVAGVGSRLRAAAVLLAVVVVPMAGGHLRLARPDRSLTVRVALVQPNVPNDEKWKPDQRAAIFDRLAEATRAGAAAGAEIVVWPETAAPCYLLKDREWRPFVEGLAGEVGIPLFVGTPDYRIVDGPDGSRRVVYTNTGALFGPDGRLAGRMDKIRLVPFGERIPFADVIPGLDRVDFGEADFVPGAAPVVFSPDGWTFGCFVCFEATFSDLAVEFARRGAQVLVTITNDSWFGARSGAEQHARMAVARCAETGCGMARAANSGISLGADGRGREIARTGLFEPALLVVDVPRGTGPTPYVRLGDWVGILARVATVCLLLAAFLGRRSGAGSVAAAADSGSPIDPPVR